MSAPHHPLEVLRHIGEANANYKLYQRLRAGQEFKWAAVVLFYSALHLVEAHRKQVNPSVLNVNHDVRREFVRTSHHPIYAHYSHLYKISIALRYELVTATAADLEDLHRDHFQPIRAHMFAHNINWEPPPKPPS